MNFADFLPLPDFVCDMAGGRMRRSLVRLGVRAPDGGGEGTHVPWEKDHYRAESGQYARGAVCHTDAVGAGELDELDDVDDSDERAFTQRSRLTQCHT